MTKPARAAFHLTSDHAFGAAGLGLAVASAAFGIGMALHGPAASFGTGRDFTVFAQLAPHRLDDADRSSKPDRAQSEENRGPSADLDMTTTASIKKRDAVAPDVGEAAVIPAVTLEAVGPDSATVAIGGRTRVVRVGDDVPGAGQIVAILAGERPALKTSRGLIVPAAE